MAKSPAIILYNADGVAMAISDGQAIGFTQGLLVAGQDVDTNARFLRTATDGTLRIDPTGTTTQPVTLDAGSSYAMDSKILLESISIELSRIRMLLEVLADEEISEHDVSSFVK
jgi:hypothetical protein